MIVASPWQGALPGGIAGLCLPCPAKWALPETTVATWQHPSLERDLDAGPSVISASPGYLPSESLASGLLATGRPVVWLRLGREDHDPAVFLLALVLAARRLAPDLGQATCQLMVARPGTLGGWPALFSRLGEELAGALPADTAVVIEKCAGGRGQEVTLRLLYRYLVPALPDRFSFMLIGPDLPPDLPGSASRWLESVDLRLDSRSAAALCKSAGFALSRSMVADAVRLADGRAGALLGLGVVAATIGPAALKRIVDQASDISDLLCATVGSWLSLQDPATQRQLVLAARLEFSQPEHAVGGREGIDRHGAGCDGKRAMAAAAGRRLVAGSQLVARVSDRGGARFGAGGPQTSCGGRRI